ncbi:MAG: magnesium and cobalt transport protein CorA [Bacteroidetes bacterium]|nr:MAG: magnesium and cobalt transport protein CorA [Bacteroidota bacterium]
MLRVFFMKEGEIVRIKNPENPNDPAAGKVLWVDLQSPTGEEQKLVESAFGVEFQTPQETAEIESSSRYYEDSNSIEANNTFLVYENHSYTSKQVSFILRDGVLFTLRDADLKTFAETVRRMKNNTLGPIREGTQLLLGLLETRIDYDADFVEFLTKQTNLISKQILKQKTFGGDTLLNITELQENTILIRESITDKQRLVSSMLRSTLMKEEDKERLRIILKDVNSLLQHTEFGFERLEYLQNSFLGFVNLEQNQIIKLFTVASVIFMPPTLIASIYGMNFDFMPELHWKGGYILAIILMILSSVGTLMYFKRRKWL